MSEVIELNKDEDINERTYEMYTRLKGSDNFSICSAQFSNILIKDFCDDDKFYYVPDEKEKYEIDPYENIKGKFSDLKGYYVDEEYVEEFPFEVMEGRSFNKGDFELKDNIPVILGSEYKWIYNIGDRFKYFDYKELKEKTIEVVGILKESSYFFDNGDISTLDNRVICPTSNLKLDDKSASKFQDFINNSLIITNNKDNSLAEIRKIRKLEVNNIIRGLEE